MSLATYKGGPKGIGAWLAYARSEGKRMCVGEWGVARGVSAGGGDNPFWVKKMLELFSKNASSIGYESYFNKNAVAIHRLQDNPKAAYAYRSYIK